MKLNVRGIEYFFEKHQQNDDLPTLVLLHGFMGSGDLFESLIEHLSPFCNPVTIDLLGHGQTEGAELHYRFSTKEQVADIVKLVQEQLSAPVFLYGYSMGARLALQVSLQRPDLFSGLILESGTFGIEVEAERQARQALDGSRADQIMGNFDDFLTQWQEMEMFSNSSSKQQKEIQEAQNPYWIANSLLAFGTGTMPCVRERLSELSTPTLLLAGGDDSKFVRINQSMSKAIPDAKLGIIPKTGHRVHIESPKEIAQHLEPFIKTHQL
ncbi:MAG: 2-succinyl-6-hydroxy-2,4-cyclohexadiene-1-carboxylate synthase [Balneolaceae bacterium]|nr:2-succinyl-6-hydroxy-2,4-cyclohexadiene-1-carboxylate synthase [Balneolaceae bacterium]